MTDNELLLAISNIVQSYTNPIQQQLQDTEARLDTKIDTLQSHLEGRIDSVQTYLEGRIDSVQNDLEGKISSLNSKVDSVQNSLESKISSLDSKLKHTQGDVKQIRILLENDVLPRLQNIESCYTSTYQRYADNVLQLETLQSDVDILKSVVAEHSDILRKIS